MSEAEDIAQEALLRLHRAEHIESPRAYLSTVVTPLGENRRRQSVGDHHTAELDPH